MIRHLMILFLTLCLGLSSSHAQQWENINSQVEVLSVSDVEREALSQAELIIAEALDPQIETEETRRTLRERTAKIIKAILRKAPTPTRVIQEFKRHRMLFVIEVASTGLGLAVTSMVAAQALPIYWLGVAAILGNPATTLALYSSFMAAKHVNRNTFRKHNLKSTILQVLQVAEGWKYSLISPLQERFKIGFFLSRYLTTSVVEELHLTVPVIRSTLGDRLRLGGAPLITDKELIEVVRSVYPDRADYMLERLRQAEISYDMQIEAIIRSLRMDPKLRRAFVKKISDRVDLFMVPSRTAEVDFFTKAKRITQRMTNQEASLKQQEADLLDWLSKEKTKIFRDRGLPEDKVKKRIAELKANVRERTSEALENLALKKLNFLALTRAYISRGAKKEKLLKDMDRLAEKALRLIESNRGSRAAVRCMMAGA